MNNYTLCNKYFRTAAVTPMDVSTSVAPRQRPKGGATPGAKGMKLPTPIGLAKPTSGQQPQPLQTTPGNSKLAQIPEYVAIL